jgi:hypothetical protein
MRRHFIGADAPWLKVWIKSAIAISIALCAAGCGDKYRDASEPMYHAVAQLRADAQANVDIDLFADHLGVADEAHEKWVRTVGRDAYTRKSARELRAAFHCYGRVGTIHLLDGAKTIACDAPDHVVLSHADEALMMARRDLDLGR